MAADQLAGFVRGAVGSVERVDHLTAIGGCSRCELVEVCQFVKVSNCDEGAIVLEHTLADEAAQEGNSRVRHVLRRLGWLSFWLSGSSRVREWAEVSDCVSERWID